MTVVISFAATSDGRIRSSSGSYSTALAGNALDVDTTGSALGTWGQRDSGVYQIFEYFISFPYVVDNTQVVVSSYFEFYPAINDSSGPNRDMEVREYNWGTSLTSGNWRTPSQLNSLGLLAVNRNTHNAAPNQAVRCGSVDGLQSRLGSNGPIRVVVASSRTRQQNTPTSTEEITQLYTAEHSTLSPRIVLTTVPVSTLNRSLAYQVQLSDGTHVYVHHLSAGTVNIAKEIRHRDLAGNVSVIQSETANTRTGVQNYAICRDSSDNFYIINTRDNGQTLNCQAYQKGTGYNWTPKGIHTITLNNYPNAMFNNVAATWHSVGSGGTIVVVASNTAGYNTGTYVSYALLSPVALLGTSSGNPIRDSGTAVDTFYYDPGHSGYNSYVNETSTLLDMCAAPGVSNRGFVITASRNPLDGVGVPSIARYQISGTGNSLSSVAVSLGGGLNGANIRKDANAKARLIAVSTSQFIVVTADPGTSRGITVCLVQNSGTSTNFNNLSQSRIGSMSIPDMLSPSAIAVSHNWDAVYDPNSNRLWVYWITGNSLRKTHVDLSTGLAAGDNVLVSSSVGAGGSTNLALRVHRGVATGEQILFTVANRTSGGTHSTLYLTDTFNAPPFAPTLLPRANFNASNNALFQWTFNDPNPGDTQSAFQLEISLASTGAVVHNTNKTVSASTQYNLPGGTLSNGNSYRWRVRTWDALDEIGPYSTYREFVTSSSGTLDILIPAIDNPPDVITKDNLVVWQVTGQTQAAYRVVVRRTSDEGLLVDTGWVNSADTQYLVQNMQSDVEYRISVTARNSVSVETNTAHRLLTASYASPETPIISVQTVNSGGYILVSVNNPDPQGDRPVPLRNDIYRSLTGQGVWTLIGSSEPNSEMRDYRAVDGVVYDYFARAVTE